MEVSGDNHLRTEALSCVPTVLTESKAVSTPVFHVLQCGLFLTYCELAIEPYY